MKLSQIKEILKKQNTIGFELPDGSIVPRHFHITEIGKITKHFIDCGGKVRLEEVVNFQLWHANDDEHRLHPEKLLSIIELAEQSLFLKDLEIEVEYQAETIGKFGVDFNGKNFLLTTKKTDCLAKDSCGTEKEQTSCCSPASQCC